MCIFPPSTKVFFHFSSFISGENAGNWFAEAQSWAELGQAPGPLLQCPGRPLRSPHQHQHQQQLSTRHLRSWDRFRVGSSRCRPPAGDTQSRHGEYPANIGRTVSDRQNTAAAKIFTATTKIFTASTRPALRVCQRHGVRM